MYAQLPGGSCCDSGGWGWLCSWVAEKLTCHVIELRTAVGGSEMAEALTQDVIKLLVRGAAEQ